MSTFGDVGLCAPEMNDVIVGEFEVLCIISPENNRSVLWKGLFHLISPVHLKLSIIFETLGGHECLDGRSQVPTSSKDFIASQMNVWRISKQVINLFVDLLGELVDGGFGDIELSVVALASWTGDSDILLGPFFVESP
jgi:hypothetical protein